MPDKRYARIRPELRQLSAYLTEQIRSRRNQDGTSASEDHPVQRELESCGSGGIFYTLHVSPSDYCMDKS